MEQKLIIIEKNMKGKCVAYVTNVDVDDHLDVLAAVENFFEDAALEATIDQIDGIAHDLMKRGFADGAQFHFEIVET